MTIYDRIRKLREEKGMSQQELAERVGFKTASAINKIELGLRNINQSKVSDFAKALNTTTSYLIDGEDSSSLPPMEATFRDRLNEALCYRKMSASELSKLSGVNEGAISQYRKGEYKASQDSLEKIAAVLNVSIPWLMGANVPMQPLNLVPPTVATDVITFPVLGSIAAGYEEIANEDWSGETVEIPVSYLKGRKQAEFFVLKVHGNSMYPLYHENDKILILKQNCIEHNGDIGAVIYDGECATLKRIDVFDDMVRLSPVNPEYQPKELRGVDMETYHILGVPRMLIREIS